MIAAAYNHGETSSVSRACCCLATQKQVWAPGSSMNPWSQAVLARQYGSFFILLYGLLLGYICFLCPDTFPALSTLMGLWHY